MKRREESPESVEALIKDVLEERGASYGAAAADAGSNGHRSG